MLGKLSILAEFVLHQFLSILDFSFRNLRDAVDLQAPIKFSQIMDWSHQNISLRFQYTPNVFFTMFLRGNRSRKACIRAIFSRSHISVLAYSEVCHSNRLHVTIQYQCIAIQWFYESLCISFLLSSPQCLSIAAHDY